MSANPNNPVPQPYGINYPTIDWLVSSVQFMKRRISAIAQSGGGGGSQDLASVLEYGNTAALSIVLQDNYTITLDPSTGSVSAVGDAESISITPQQIQVGNNGSVLNISSIPTGIREQTFQDADGVIALEETMTLQKVTDAGNTTSNPIYFNNGNGDTAFFDDSSVGSQSSDGSTGIEFFTDHDGSLNQIVIYQGFNSLIINQPVDPLDTSYTQYIPLESGTILTDAQKGVPNGLATLDGSGVVPNDQLPYTLLDYKGSWDADTNTPTLADGVGDVGDIYIVSVAGSQDLGSGTIAFTIGNMVIYNGAIWEKIGAVVTATVTSVSSADNTWLTVANGTTTPVLTVVSAPKLATARTINNVPFDGTANILLNQSINAQTGTTYTFVLADNQKTVTANNVSTQIYTVPTNAAQGFPIGARIDIIQKGTGKVTIAADSGVTVNTLDNAKRSIAGQYGAVTLLKEATDTWYLIGNLIA